MRRYRRETLRAAYQAALLVYQQELSAEAAAAKMACSASKVFRLLRIADELKMVRRSVIEVPDSVQSAVTAAEVARVSDMLRDELKLRSVTIVDAAPDLVGKRKFDCKNDEKLADILGQAAAPEFATALRDGDRIAVGSGRSAQFTISAIEHDQLLTEAGLPQCTAVSLAGGIRAIYPYSRDSTGLLSSPTADGSAAMMAWVLKGRSQPTVHPYLGTPSSSAYFRERLEGVPLGLMGIGAVVPDITNCFEQFRVELRDAKHVNDLALQVVGLAEAMRQELKARGVKPFGALYFPLADGLGRPFVPEPPGAVLSALGSRKFRQYRDQVKELATHVHAADTRDIAQIGHLVLVAGGARKAFPIWHFLTELRRDSRPLDESRRHALVTDHSTAVDVLNVARGMRKTEDHLDRVAS